MLDSLLYSIWACSNIELNHVPSNVGKLGVYTRVFDPLYILYGHSPIQLTVF